MRSNHLGTLAKAAAFAVLASPAFALAQSAGDTCTDAFCKNGLGKLGLDLVGFINHVLVPVVFAIAFIVFLYGIFKGFILGAASDEKRKEGQQVALWGVIGFAIMISLWGLVNVVTATAGIDGASKPTPPQL